MNAPSPAITPKDRTDMSELIERLRAWSKFGYHEMHTEEGRKLYSEAADRITRLEADRVELIEALKGAVKWALVSDDPRSTKDLHAAEAVLRRIKEN